MLRNLLGSVVALLGAVITAWSPFLPWYGGLPGRDIPVQDLFTGPPAGDGLDGLTARDAALLDSMFLPLALAALLALLGVMLQSRLAVAVAGLLAMGSTTLWAVRLGLALGSLTIGGERGLGNGAAAAMGGGLLSLLGAALMRGYRGGPVRERRGGGAAAPGR